MTSSRSHTILSVTALGCTPNGSTLHGPSHFPVLEDQTHQPVKLLDRDDANLGMRDLPNEFSTMTVCPKADLFDGLEDL
ncbi:hypothetical protein [Candidatus Methylacidithermus pantelleriae]|uniref:hypothetical protein n=1 Tax=Candidatus Methylacidithermus pantelleriae TaxID=2744239 RepID=UPI00157CC967|nr:hypothetical protein [Candidatus Methylacidithermus pantelleriae]